MLYVAPSCTVSCQALYTGHLTTVLMHCWILVSLQTTIPRDATLMFDVELLRIKGPDGHEEL
eukprot:m.54442 g.54442  ORF g.54442 m.54442 type:complete len:62 (+) comp7527_c0_seq1:137-322(+)